LRTFSHSRSALYSDRTGFPRCRSIAWMVCREPLRRLMVRVSACQSISARAANPVGRRKIGGRSKDRQHQSRLMWQWWSQRSVGPIVYGVVKLEQGGSSTICIHAKSAMTNGFSRRVDNVFVRWHAAKKTIEPLTRGEECAAITCECIARSQASFRRRKAFVQN